MAYFDLESLAKTTDQNGNLNFSDVVFSEYGNPAEIVCFHM